MHWSVCLLYHVCEVSAILHWLGDVECSHGILNYCLHNPVTFPLPTLTPSLFKPTSLLCSPHYLVPSLHYCRHLLSSVMLPTCFPHPSPLQNFHPHCSFFALSLTSQTFSFLQIIPITKSRHHWLHTHVPLSISILILVSSLFDSRIVNAFSEVTSYMIFLILVHVNITWNGP